MKKKIFFLLVPFVVVSIVLSFQENQEKEEPESTEFLQQRPDKPQDDYMSSILSRNTQPLGLKEDKELREFLGQPAIKWAVRSAYRHALH